MCDSFNLMARVNEKPGRMCSFEKYTERPYRSFILPYMTPGRRNVNRAAKSEPKGKPCFNLKSGNDHASDSIKIMITSSGIASYSTDVTWGYRRAPFGGGTAIAGSPSPAKGGAVSDSAQRPLVPWDFEVWYQPSTLLTGVTPESSPAHLPVASSVQQQQQTTSSTVAPPESSPVSLIPTPPATVASLKSSLVYLLSVQVPAQQKHQPRGYRRQCRGRRCGNGGAWAAAWLRFDASRAGNITMIIAYQSPPHMPAPELHSCPASELTTPDSYREAC